MIIFCLLLGLASIVMMKKKRESAFIIAFLIAASLFFLMEGSVRAGILGDANADGDVNIDDADFISGFLVGLVPSLPNPDDADVNGDGKVDIIDAMIIAQYANHLRDELPLTVDSPPTAIGTATPSTGPAPLNVNFNGTGTDPDGTIVLYEWKFTSHGTYDYSSATSAATSHTYNEPDKYIAVFRVTDDDGLVDTDSVLISVSGPPISKPGAFPTSGEAPLAVTFFSNGEDLDGSPEYYDWDFNGDGVNDQHLIASMNTEYTFTQAGTYNATLTVTDNEGLTGSASIAITVSEGTNPQGYPTAIAAATPSNGGAPLQVTLVGKGTDEDGTIIKLEWDFEGDGVFDFVDTVVSSNILGEVIDAGSYSSPELIDIDNDGDLDLFIGGSGGRICFYRNDGDSSAPVWTSAGLVADSSGNMLDVGSYSSPDFVDIDGDDDYDAIIGNSSGYIYLYSTAGGVTHIYSTPGTYEATLRVTDNDDKITTDSVTITVLKTGTPTATASANPTSGDVPLDVAFNGTGKDSDGAITLYEWDFDGDGLYDWSSSVSGNTSHTYNNVGSYVATLRVTDNEGNTSIDSIIISTSLGISASGTAIFDPVSGGAGSVNSTITGDSIVTVKVIDQSGNAVRTLADNESRTAGTYTDTWDGKDDTNKIVRDGVYYFLIEHTENGETQILDLRETAQYRELDPGRTWPSTFNPYKENYVQVTYFIPYPAEVSMYFWKRDSSHPGSSIAPVRTMFIRKPKDAGSHTEIWDGVDDKGVVVGNWSGGYCITLWTYELPSNAIIITGNTPIITDVGAAPNLFSPAYNPYGSTEPNYTVVSFNLSEAANIEIKIKNTNGVTVKSFLD
jgi:PKD repeat protein